MGIGIFAGVFLIAIFVIGSLLQNWHDNADTSEKERYRDGIGNAVFIGFILIGSIIFWIVFTIN